MSAYDEAEQKINFRLFGIGVGDLAVGSTGIYQVTFEPRVIRDMESATWGFRSKHDFERASVVVYRWEKEGYWQESRTLDTSCDPERGKRCEGSWDGNGGEGSRLEGSHLVAAKAWQSENEKDWIFAISEDEVEVR